MLSIQHAMCLINHNPNADSKLIASTLYPDAVRAYSGPRQYSHFEKSEDGSFSYYMTFPNDMHVGKDVIQERISEVEPDISLVRPCAIGEDTDIQAFYDHNKRLDKDVKHGIDYHLHQDMIFDKFVRDEIDCSDKYNDKFVFRGQQLDGKDLRCLIGDIEQHGIYIMAHKLYEEKGITANQDWLLNNIKPALDKEYSSDLADKTYSFMNINPMINELISNHDWSRIADSPLPLSVYEKLYDDVEASMSDVDTSYPSVEQRELPSFDDVDIDKDDSFEL